jgi:type IV pilus assembly protein PilA
MSTELKAKFIQYLNYKYNETGFTLIELLVVIVIIGILAAIALPNFLNQSVKAKESEAQQNIGSIGRVQSIYRSHKDRFASTFDLLAIGTLSGNTGNASTRNYNYTLTATNDNASIIAQAKDPILKGYSGANNFYINANNLSIATTILCRAVTPGITAPTTPVTPANAAPTCTAPYIKL